MQEIRVDSLEHKVSGGGKDFTVVKSGDKSYYIWDTEEAKKVSEGRTAKCDVDTSGKYWKITKVYEQETEPEQPKQSPKSPPANGGRDDDIIVVEIAYQELMRNYTARQEKPNLDNLSVEIKKAAEAMVNVYNQKPNLGDKLFKD